MVFSSIVFLLFFLPIFLLVYHLVPKSLKNIVLLGFSIFFYSWGAPLFIFVILGTTLLDFFLVGRMDASESEAERKTMLTISVLVNLGLLFYFKYSNFFVENINTTLKAAGLHTAIHWTKLALPIGISFYTFETLTYVVDVYRRVHKPLKNFWDYQLYIILFPKLIAGPITRYHDIAAQITDRTENETIDLKLIGFYRFIIGLSKKMLIANAMGAQADSIMQHPIDEISWGYAWFGALAYTMQIYFDFSGYSDMAVGICNMVGFRLPENFNSPYTATSITDFWRRWHITLGSWMRNYLYIPLGGNQVATPARLYANLWIVFLASGFWHGASWSFLFWGAYHGFFLVAERSFLNKFYAFIGKYPSMLLTFLLVLIGWVFFRIEKLSDGFQYLKLMFSPQQHHRFFLLNNDFYPVLIVALCFSFFAMTDWGKKAQAFVFERTTYSLGVHAAFMSAATLFLALCVAMIAGSNFNPFIYFRF